LGLESILPLGRIGDISEASMPKPYSADLRERVLLAGAAGLPPAAAAERFGVGLSTVYLWRQQARAEGRRCAKPHGGGRARGIDAAGEAILRALVAERNDRTLDEYRELLAARGGKGVSRPTLCRVLGRLGLRRKKRRYAPASGIAPISKRSGRSSVSGSASSTPRIWSSSTRVASPRQ
jgi:transposase